MARREKPAPNGPNNGYLISFGDTMTALLAFFIVLNSLAKEQTGANLHAGTGSFIRSLESFGLPGIFKKKRSSQAFQLEQTSPLYLVPDDQNREPEPNAKGPDDNSDLARIVDRDLEQFHRFVTELKRLTELQQLDDVSGEFSLDVLGTFPEEVSPLRGQYLEAARQLAPLLRRDDYAVEITVWATVPSASAWKRAVLRADRLRNEIIRYLQLRPEQQGRLHAVGRPWLSSDVQRPAASFTVKRLSPAER